MRARQAREQVKHANTLARHLADSFFRQRITTKEIKKLTPKNFLSVYLLRISPYSVRMRKNTDQKSSEYGHFLCSDSQGRLILVGLTSLNVFIIKFYDLYLFKYIH